MDKDSFFPLHLKIKNKIKKVICIRKPLFSLQICAVQQSVSLRFVRVKCWMCFKCMSRVPACARRVAVSSVRGGRWVGEGLWFPVLSWRLSQFVRVRKGKRKRKKKINCKREEVGGVLPRPPPADHPPPASVLSLVVVVFLLLAVGQRGAGADLPVAVQPLLHHLGDKWVVAAAGAFLKSHQNPALRHAAVQPLPQQLLLLLFITHLKDRGGKQIWPSDGAVSLVYSQISELFKLCAS